MRATLSPHSVGLLALLAAHFTLGCGRLALPDDLDRDGFTAAQGDCDDADAQVHPGAEEGPVDDSGEARSPNGIDDDCDGVIDEGTTGFDDDSDGYCELGPCSDGGPGGDCNDADSTVFPTAPELEDGLDNDCDDPGLIDEGTTGFDDDGDGYCDAHIDGSCVDGSQPGDCDDANAEVHPGGDETSVCDGIDNDCNGFADDGFDLDGDTWTECMGDRDDQDPDIFPGAAELCDGKDNDLDGQTDEDFDADGDGHVNQDDPACLVWVDQVQTAEGDPVHDCDDTDPTVHGSAKEQCNEIDDDCDGLIDADDWDDDDELDLDGDGAVCENDPGDCEGDPLRAIDHVEVFDGVDNDCDGLIDEGSDLDDDGYAVEEGDCDDADPDVNPGATEECDCVDNDCDGVIDDETSADCETWGLPADEPGECD